MKEEVATAEPEAAAVASTAALDSIKALATDTVSDLAEGWVEKFDPKKQKPYYVNKAEKKTQWIKPVSMSASLVASEPAPVDHATDERATTEEESDLPAGWIEKFDDKQHHRPYYVNAEKQVTQWVRPTAEGAPAAQKVDAVPVESETDESSSGEDSDDDDEAGETTTKKKKKAHKFKHKSMGAMLKKGESVAKSKGAMHKAHGHDSSEMWTDVKQASKVRHKLHKPKKKETFADVLFQEEAAEDLHELLDQMFTLADSKGAGKLTNMGLNSMIRKRAKGGRLHGNLFAQMKLSKQLDEHDTHAITREMFIEGMMQVMRSERNGPVAEWIWLEFDAMDEASSETSEEDTEEDTEG
jgi:hypothetical protein